ncbi:hypothetical protein HYS91_02945 [Candidatus Daviesbacteria bacterium]|nr:hypothetical protein [Candidatus Daviesbacteria bacterium]
MKKDILEATILLVLLVNILRVLNLTNQLVLIILAFLLTLFFIFSILTLFGKKSNNSIRFFAFLLLILTLYIFLFLKIFSLKGEERWQKHDGAILTEFATQAFLDGKNPYSFNYKKLFENTNVAPLKEVYEHYMYSPLMFIINAPIQFFSMQAFKVADFKVTVLFFLILAGLVGSSLVKEKILFASFFFLNPLFLPLSFYGANEAILLFFIFLVLFFLKYKRTLLSTSMLVLGLGTKILILPLVPLYFIFLFYYIKGYRNLSLFIKNILVFLILTMLIYLPFAVWDFPGLVGDVIFFHLKGGVESHVIAGFLGLPQLLSSLQVISPSSSFPFYIFQLIIEVIFLLWARKIFQRNLKIEMLSLLFIINLCVLLLFSRIIQTSYIAFISQVFLLIAFF